MNDDIDTLLGDMIDLGLSESRVKLIIKYSYILDKERYRFAIRSFRSWNVN